MNNAGMVAVGVDPRAGSAGETTDDQWSRGLDRNLTTAFLDDPGAATRHAATRAARVHRQRNLRDRTGDGDET